MVPDVRDLFTTSEGPELGPARRSGTKSIAEIDKALGPKPNPLVRATVLLWHDQLDEAHTVSQAIETPDGSYLHGIVHRREPDYSNAKYWFHRVRRHACFDPLARQAASRLQHEQKLHDRLLPRQEWDPFAFIDACEEAERGRLSGPQIALLRSIQAAELEILLAHFSSR
jgi:hypothetical protein